jgi:hypothetical protein
MLRFVVIGLGIAAIVAEANFALAGCSCGCSEGRVASACTSTTDIAPICPAIPCPIPSIRQPPPMVVPGRSGCRERYICDKYARCEWKPTC